MIRSIDDYLGRLRKELAGCDPRIIEDAVSVSEEHLRTALESGIDLNSAMEKYGTPEEVAAGYRELEDRSFAFSEKDNHTSRVSNAWEKTSRSRMKPTVTSAGHSAASIILMIIGIFILLVSFGLVVGGSMLIWADDNLTDDEGYYMTDTLRMDRSSYAIISEPAEVKLGSSGAFNWGNLVTFKAEVSSADPESNVFIGVAREDDVSQYLGNVAYDMIIDFKVDSSKFEYSSFTGNDRPNSPTEQNFWEESAYGPGTQILEWELETGTWIFVIMNVDASAGIDAEAEIGARVPWILDIGIVLLVCGIVGILIGLLMLFLSLRRKGGSTVSA